MGEVSKIEWCDATFNPWRGCTKISQGCAHCYAETLSGRNPAVLGEWGPKGVRAFASDEYLRQPLIWARKLPAQLGRRPRVFCASLGDVFEDRPELVSHRTNLLNTINITPELDWLLLTKRPENIRLMLEECRLDLLRYSDHARTGEWLEQWMKGQPPANVWLGTSVEDQETANTRIPILLATPAAVRWLSCEPLLGPVDLYPSAYHPCPNADEMMMCPDTGAYECCSGCDYTGIGDEIGIDWVVVGGESGRDARPMHPRWVRSLRDQCVAAEVPFLFKQHGEWVDHGDVGANVWVYQREVNGVMYGKVFGGPLSEKDFETRYPWASEDGVIPRACVVRVGKKAAGRMLDGRTWDEYPEVRA